MEEAYRDKPEASKTQAEAGADQLAAAICGAIKVSQVCIGTCCMAMHAPRSRYRGVCCIPLHALAAWCAYTPQARMQISAAKPSEPCS